MRGAQQRPTTDESGWLAFLEGACDGKRRDQATRRSEEDKRRGRQKNKQETAETRLRSRQRETVRHGETLALQCGLRRAVHGLKGCS